MVIYLSNDNLLEIIGLLNETDNTYVNNATITVTLLDSNGAEVSGQNWPASFVYVTDSDGDYQVVLNSVVALSASQDYTAKITAVSGNLDGYWEVPLRAKVRTD